MSSNGQIPAASFPIGPPLGGIAIGQTIDGKSVFASQSFYQLLDDWWAGIQNEGGIKPQADQNTTDISVVFDMSGDGTLSAAGVLTVKSSEGRFFVLSAFALPSLTLAAPAQFRVVGSPWSQAGTITIETAPPVAVADLPASPSDGDRNFVNDSNVAAATNFGEAVAGGGANHVPVYYDGGTSTWRIG